MDLWEKRTHQFSNENLQKPHLQLLEVLLFASFHLLPHNVHFGTTRSPHPLTWTSCWVSRWRNPHGIPGVKLLFVSGKGKIQIIFVGSFWKQKNCTKPNDFVSCWKEKQTPFQLAMFSAGFQASTTIQVRSAPVDSLRPHGIGVNGVTVSAVLRLGQESLWTTTTYLEDHPLPNGLFMACKWWY